MNTQSDTPRTDAAQTPASTGDADDYSPMMVCADFARGLERENAALKHRERQFEGFTWQVARLVGCLPDYSNPSEDNAHVIDAIKKLSMQRDRLLEALKRIGYGTFEGRKARSLIQRRAQEWLADSVPTAIASVEGGVK